MILQVGMLLDHGSTIGAKKLLLTSLFVELKGLHLFDNLSEQVAVDTRNSFLSKAVFKVASQIELENLKIK